MLENLYTVLQKQHENNFVEEVDSYVRPYAAYEAYPTSFELPSVLVPPEVIELDAFSNDLGEEPKKEEWSEYSIRLFDNEVRLYHITITRCSHLQPRSLPTQIPEPDTLFAPPYFPSLTYSKSIVKNALGFSSNIQSGRNQEPSNRNLVRLLTLNPFQAETGNLKAPFWRSVSS